MGTQDQDSSPMPEELSELAESSASDAQAPGLTQDHAAPAGVTPEAQASSTDEPQEHTGPTGENQAEGSAAGPGKVAAADPQSPTEWYEWKVRRSNDLLDDIERLVLLCVDREVPRPYYENWVGEANEMFRLMSRLKKRAKFMGIAIPVGNEPGSVADPKTKRDPSEAQAKAGSADTSRSQGESEDTERASEILDTDFDDSAA